MDQPHPHLDERVPVERRGFHSRDGLYFRRNEDASVTITKEDAPWHEGRGTVVAQITLDEASWASVVSSVSLAGETNERWHAARKFHGLPDA